MTITASIIRPRLAWLVEEAARRGVLLGIEVLNVFAIRRQRNVAGCIPGTLYGLQQVLRQLPTHERVMRWRGQWQASLWVQAVSGQHVLRVGWVIDVACLVQVPELLPPLP